QAAYSHR
ncbi:hypothetical protein EC900039_4539B, partial [Escherichia coli 90.0039]